MTQFKFFLLSSASSYVIPLTVLTTARRILDATLQRERFSTCQSLNNRSSIETKSHSNINRGLSSESIFSKTNSSISFVAYSTPIDCKYLKTIQQKSTFNIFRNLEHIWQSKWQSSGLRDQRWLFTFDANVVPRNFAIGSTSTMAPPPQIRPLRYILTNVTNCRLAHHRTFSVGSLHNFCDYRRRSTTVTGLCPF
ncbi:hypothetical protein T4C_10196 [Trichinella pseudospiralis]|uniref:Uncharacterized protein n=1 Tax=Trichinella pseudospiralis TaxID=6337 RepID=A0A0V1JQ55_TRIPS|nr:hypothetical protein T4C_10196 [Trichinella pseudospiralis]